MTNGLCSCQKTDKQAKEEADSAAQAYLSKIAAQAEAEAQRNAKAIEEARRKSLLAETLGRKGTH